MVKIIFDCGANVGDNLEYYLSKNATVVAVEANPNCCQIISQNFKKYILSSQLFVENIALYNKKTIKNFFIHKKHNQFSTFFPKKSKIKNYRRVKVKTELLSNLIKKYQKKFKKSNIHYIKIDIENADHIALKDLILNNIYSEYLSIEVTNSKTIEYILKSKYKSFKFVKGYDQLLKSKKINKNNGTISFYGKDNKGKYYKKSSILNYFLNNRFNWVDLHCKLKKSKQYEKDHLLDTDYISSYGFKYHLKSLYSNFFDYLKYSVKLRLNLF